VMYCIAYNYSEYLSWCRMRQINPYKDAKYLGTHMHIMSLRDVTITLIRRWKEREDFNAINVELEYRVMKDYVKTEESEVFLE